MEAAHTSLRENLRESDSTDDDIFENSSYVPRKTITIEHLEDEFGISIAEETTDSIIEHSSLPRIWNGLDTRQRVAVLQRGLNIPVDESDVKDSSWEVVRGHVVANLEFSAVWYSIPIHDYTELAPDTEEWNVGDHPIADGNVFLSEPQLYNLFKQVFREQIKEGLPFDVPQPIAIKVDDAAAEVMKNLPDELTTETVPSAVDILSGAPLDFEFPLGIENTDKYEPLGRGETDIPLNEIRSHYETAEPVYEELGVTGEFHTSWLNSHRGWYVEGEIESRSEHPEAWDNGFPNWRRASILPDDFDASETARSVYTTNTYSPLDAYHKRFYKVTDSGRVWMDEEMEDMESIHPLPQYDEIGAYSLIVDIDLDDHWKNRPLPDNHRNAVERRLKAWVAAFSKFVGDDPSNVFVVDSGGGAYVLTPPAATYPIYEEFEPDERYHIHKEIRARMRELTDAIDSLVTESDDAPKELFSADDVQNKNRQWKTLLSVHSSTDSVVTPIPSTDVTYEKTAFDDVTDEHYANAQQWAADFTDTSYSDLVDTLVKTLFTSDVFETELTTYDPINGDSWKDILRTVVEKRESEAEEFDFSEIDRSFEDVGVTTEKKELDAAIASVSLEKYLRKKHVQEWDTDNRSDNTISFSPRTWRTPSKDANSCFYSPSGGSNGAPIFRDRKEGWTAGILDLIAYEEEITDHPSETPSGENWWEAVEALRSRGEDIPVLLPDITDDSYEHEKLGESHIAQAALAFGNADEDDIEEVNGQYGSYERLTNDAAYNATLKELEERGIKHGRDYRSDESESEDDV